MNQSNYLVSCFLFVFCIHTGIYAQIPKGAIQADKITTATIEPTESHQYLIELEAEQLAFFELMQDGVDMKVTTYHPDGSKLKSFDSPNGKNGPEPFNIIATSKGTYKVTISPFDEKEPAGHYYLQVNSIQDKAKTLNGQVDQLFIPWDKEDCPGASIAVVKDGKIIHKNGYGMANLEYDIPNGPTTIFHVASVSKQFTVFSILLLEKEGKLSLDDDIRKYIPEVPDFGKTITLRHLASHTSGLRDQWNLLVMAGWRFDDVITTEHVLKLVRHQKELNFAPGEEYAYCNTGFTLLAEVVARVSEKSFATYTEENIFKPLNMSNSLFYDDHEKIVKNRAYSYRVYGNGYKKSVLSYANVGATSLFTTVEDLSLWSMNFTNMTIGDAAIFKKMNTLAVLNNGETFGGALGQFIGNYKGLHEISHGGADAGYRTFLSRFPNEQFSVIVFSNMAEFNPVSLSHSIADVYLKDLYKTVKAEEKITEEKPHKESIVIDQNTLQTYVGEYELGPGININISEKDGQLTAEATGQGQAQLNPISLTNFTVEGIDATLEFIPNNGEQVALVKLHQNGQTTEAPRVQAFDKGTINLKEFAGEYYSEELMTTYHFVLQEGVLTAKHQRVSDFAIRPIKKDVFASDLWFFGQIEYVRETDGTISGFKVSNGRVRNLHFKKMK